MNDADLIELNAWIVKASVAEARIEAYQQEMRRLRGFISSFSLTCVENSFYKDCYLSINDPVSINFRLGNGSQFSQFIAALEKRRVDALKGSNDQ